MEATQLTIRRLDPDLDQSLVAQAVSWLGSQPLFFRNCDAAWGTEGADEYLRQMRNDPQADFGVFDSEEFIAVITVSLKGKGVYESHLMAKRGSDVSIITLAVINVLKGMIGHGMKEGWMWLAKKNYGVRRILGTVGFKRDGLSILKGQSHGQPIEWVRYSVRIV